MSAVRANKTVGTDWLTVLKKSPVTGVVPALQVSRGAVGDTMIARTGPTPPARALALEDVRRRTRIGNAGSGPSEEDARVSALNAAAESLFGTGLLGRHYAAVFRQPALLARIESALASRRPAQARHVLERVGQRLTRQPLDRDHRDTWRVQSARL